MPEYQIHKVPEPTIVLPPELEGLYELAYNLWWTWQPRAQSLFSSIDGAVWARYRNPVELLSLVDGRHWSRLLENETFMADYGRVLRTFEEYRDGVAGAWYRTAHPERAEDLVAYFSMEYGLHESLALYSGGLGVLSGDHCKTASDLGLRFVAVGLLYRFGYFRQTLDADGVQQHSYIEYDFARLPVRPVARRTGQALVVQVPFPGREVAARVWVAEVGRVPLLLLDTDIEENDVADRPITNSLYTRGREMRLAQELLLGVGGARALEALGVEPAVYHVNEGHSALLQLERLRRRVEDRDQSFEEALEEVRANLVFTTHTPVPAGHETFERPVARQYLEPWAELLSVPCDRLLDLGNADHGQPDQPFNLTALALRTCSYSNGVSRLNSEVSGAMWGHLIGERPIEAITNGVHVPTWIGPEIGALFEGVLGADWQDRLASAEPWQRLLELEDEALWAAHLAQKERLGRFLRSRLREQSARHGRSPEALRAVSELFDSEVLTIGFARRFATYKRAQLIFSDMHRLRTLLRHHERPVQLVFAGKAHPADRPGQELIQHIFNLSHSADLAGRVFFLENYDMRVAHMLVQGCDVWLNTPRRPMEASGTSGQKAAINGVLPCSILDGWWPEGFDGTNGWAIGGADDQQEEWLQDQEDVLALYTLLEEQIVPEYYERDEEGRPQRWLERMRRAIATVGAGFSSHRMVIDYVERAYLAHARRRLTTA